MSEEPNSTNADTSGLNTNENNCTSSSHTEANFATPPTLSATEIEKENKGDQGTGMDDKGDTEHEDRRHEDVSTADNVSNGNPEDSVLHEEETVDKDKKLTDNEVEDNSTQDHNVDRSVISRSTDDNGSDNVLSETDGAQANKSEASQETLGATADDDTKLLSPGDSIYHIKWIYFKKKLVPIVTQNENGPCPLLAILNVLLLQSRVKITAKTEVVTANQLMTYLGDCVLENVPTGSDEGMAASARLNFEQNMQDAMAVMYKLQTGIDVNVRFTGIRDFEYTPECIIFDLLQISLYHGWLVDPQNMEEVTAVGTCSYNQLVEKIINQKTSDQTEIVSQALVAEQFLESSASQLTYHGLSELSSQLKEDELTVLFRNNHFITLYRHNNELFQLVTDQGFLQESNVVWETLSNVEGDCHFVDSEFRTYTKPEPVFNPVEVPESHLNMDEQIEQDYMVALSIQQDQQDQMAWAQVDPQQPIPTLSDLELARSLQEEERRAAMAEQERNQRQQSPGAPRSSTNLAQRQPQRVDSRESKKSDCCIL